MATNTGEKEAVTRRRRAVELPPSLDRKVDAELERLSISFGAFVRIRLSVYFDERQPA